MSEAEGGLLDLVRTSVRAHRELNAMVSAAELDILLDAGIVHAVPPGARIDGGFGEGAGVSLLLAGSLEVEAATGDTPLTLTPGDLLGGLSLFDTGASVERARSLGEGLLIHIPREIANPIFEQVPALLMRFFERYHREVLETTVRAAPVLVDLDAAQREGLVEHASLAGYRRGTRIVEAGEAGDAFYLVVDGLAGVRLETVEGGLNLGMLRRGDHFGEWSLLARAPRAATVAAMTRVVAARIDARVFAELVASNRGFGERVNASARERADASSAFARRLESASDLGERISAIRRVFGA